MVWNTGFGFAGSLATTLTLQRLIPSYGGRVGFVNSVIDIGIMMLFMGVSMIVSVNSVRPTVDSLKKQWIVSLNKDYVKKMTEIKSKHNITILEQI